jgi:hypothetical protein
MTIEQIFAELGDQSQNVIIALQEDRTYTVSVKDQNGDTYSQTSFKSPEDIIPWVRKTNKRLLKRGSL